MIRFAFPFLLPLLMFATADSSLLVYKQYLRSLGCTPVERVMQLVDRRHYVRQNPYSLHPQPIYKNGVNISAPSVHAFALKLALEHTDIDKVKNILDVGHGSGYLTACFAQLFPQAAVYGMERYSGLVDISKRNVRSDPVSAPLLGTRISLQAGNALAGEDLATLAPASFEVINMGTAHKGLPPELTKKLSPGGIIIFPEEVSAGYYSEQYFRVYRRQDNGTMKLIHEEGAVVYIKAQDAPVEQ